MLIPQEPPYLQGLNSYYLKIDKFVEHLQGEIGSGCLYFRSSSQEILIYFDENDILRSVVQDKAGPAQLSTELAIVLEAVQQRSFQVFVFQLDANAIFFWGQIPPFQRAKKDLLSTHLSLPDLLLRLQQKRFSGFIHVKLQEINESALLFFHNGERIGGSYSWGTGGLDAHQETFNQLAQKVEKTGAVFSIGHFLAEQKKKAEKSSASLPDKATEQTVFFSNLDVALEEFLDHFISLLQKKIKSDPVILLRQQFVDKVDIYPFLDPFKELFEYTSEGIRFSDDAPQEQIAAAIVDCAWNVVQQNKLEKKFRAIIDKWEYKIALEERGITVER